MNNEIDKNTDLSNIHSTSYEIKQICNSFFKKNDLKFFSHIRFYKSGGCHMFSTQPLLYDHFISKNSKYGVVAPAPLKYIKSKFRFLVTEDDRYAWEMDDFINLFNFKYPCAFIKIKRNYLEFNSIAGHRDNQKSLNMFINQSDDIEKFIDKFNEKIETNILKTPKIFLPKIAMTGAEEIWKNYDKILKNIKTKHKLTKREMDVINLYTKGRSAHEISLELKIAKRTVESHINNIKAKLQTQKRSEIYDYIHSKKNEDEY